MTINLADYDEPFLIPGERYLFLLTEGWCAVGYYIKYETGLLIRIAHSNYFENAGKSYANFVIEGANKDCQWKYEGNALICITQIIKILKYNGEIPHEQV